MILVPTVPWALPVQRGIRGVLRSIFRICWYFPGLRGELQLRFPHLLWALLLRCCSSCLVFCWWYVCIMKLVQPRMDDGSIDWLFVGGWLSFVFLLLLVVVSSRFFVNFLSLLLSLLLFYFRKGGYKHPRGAIIERWHDETTTQLSRRSKRKVKVKLKHNHSLQRVTVIQPALHQLPSSVLRYSV